MNDYLSLSPQYDTSLLIPKMKYYLKQLLAEELRCQVEEIGDQAVFVDDLGVDSIVNYDIVDKLSYDFGEQSATLLFDYTTIEKLTEFFIKNFPKEVRKVAGEE